MTASDARTSDWDFFVSYTQADRAWAEWIAWQLEEDHHRVLIQAWDFIAGSNWIQSMQEGTSKAERTIAVLSDAYLTSVYGGAEWQAAWAADPTGERRKLLTVRVSDCNRPGLLAGVVGIDLLDAEESQCRTRLQRMIQGAIDGRVKPSTAPAFPPTQRAIPRAARFPGALPRVWNLPARNPNFTGRADDLTVLAVGLASGTAVTVHSLHGMGGIGKTQLATEYAYAHAGLYDVVWWIAAEAPTLIPDQFARLSAKLGLPIATGDPDGGRGQVHEELQRTPGWLLIFDNAETVDGIHDWLPAAPLPRGVPGHVLITTRRGGFTALGRVVDLDILDPVESVRLLRTRVPSIDPDIATRIVEELDGLPLALEQAAAYLDKTQMSADRYLDLLRTRAEDLYRRGVVAGRKDTIATLWDISLTTLTEHDPAAVQLLSICAYLAPVPIPLDLFTNHPDLLPQPLAAAAGDELDFADVLAAVVDYSLARRSPEGLQLHRLVQAAIRARHDIPKHGAHPPGTADHPSTGGSS